MIVLRLLLILFIAGCAPLYETTYMYDIPSSSEGKRCVVHCRSIKNKCIQWSNEQYQNCVRNAENMKLITDVSSAIISANKNESNIVQHNNTMNKFSRERDGYIRSCERERDRNEENCLLDYNACYELCGGIIHKEVTCVENCK